MSEQSASLLFELGTEELPPTALYGLMNDLAEQLSAGLTHTGLAHGEARAYGSPRHLAVIIPELLASQPDQTFERVGPSVDQAFDRAGRPTNAALGFARSCGVAAEALEKTTSSKGERLVHRGVAPGQTTASLLPEIVAATLERVALPRRMRWGIGETGFIRPVHWVVLLYGHEVIPARVFDVTAGRETRGHRFHHPQPIRLERAEDYTARLTEPGRVMVDFPSRREEVQRQVAGVAQEAGGAAVLDTGLLDEVTALVEWPIALTGSFDAEFLRVPEEALISSMQQHQRYFPMRDGNGALLPAFVVVANLVSRHPEQVRRGNERVLRPRLADAAFFWDQDRSRSLASRIEALQRVVFQQRLGSLFDKSARLAGLVSELATNFDVDAAQAERAAWLAKTDLLTEMVGEFPELQGIMGRYYARESGEPGAIAQALEEVYQPRAAGGSIPRSNLGCLLALGERIDTLVGLFGIGQPPSGAKDPFALRRAALGVLRIAIEGKHDLSLAHLIDRSLAWHGHQDLDLAADTANLVIGFLSDRLTPYYEDRGIPRAVVDAALARGFDNPVELDQRLHAVMAFRRLPAAEALTGANKRIRNILAQARKVGEPVPDAAEAGALQAPAEVALHAALEQAKREVLPLFTERRFELGLGKLAELREPVDVFFDEVMVMSNDMAQRRNRLALLAQLDALFLHVADISRL